MTEVTLSLPDELAQQAQRAGLLQPEALEALLQPEALEALLREAMRARRVDRLFETMGRLRSQSAPLTEEDVQAEIRAARAARRARHADRR